MITPESMAIDLLEYKVAELRSKSAVRGGLPSVWELVGYLERQQAKLTPEQRNLLATLNTSLASYRPAAAQSPVPALDALVIGGGGAAPTSPAQAAETAPKRIAETPQERAEQMVLRELAWRVWWDELDEFSRRIAAAWRAEQGRVTARLIYATLQNINLNADRSTLTESQRASGFKVVEPVPSLRDPLVALSDVDALAELVREIVALVMSAGKPASPLPLAEGQESEALSYVEKAAATVAANPYLGAPGPEPNSGLTSDQLKVALQELQRERLPEVELSKQRRMLELRLQETSARERVRKKALTDEIALFRERGWVFFERLAAYLPKTVGGRAGRPRLEGGVLFGVNPVLRWETVPPDASAVTIRLVGPVRLTLSGHDLAISFLDGQPTLYLDGHETELEGTRVLRAGETRFATYRNTDYVHVRVGDAAPPLGKRLAEALVVAFVMASTEQDVMLGALRILSGSERGDTQAVVEGALKQAASVASRAPDRLSAVRGLLAGSVKAAGTELSRTALERLALRVAVATDGRAGDPSELLTRAGVTEFDVQTVTSEPLSFEVGQLKATIREYRSRESDELDNLAIMVPGKVLGSFSDHLVVQRPEGLYGFARGADEVAVFFVPTVTEEHQ